MIQYKQKGNAFEYDRLRCLRNDYYNNNCRECLEICPENAFFFDRKRFSFDVAKCISCGVCIGVCPSEALHLEFFDPNDYIVKNDDKEVHLSCKKDIPCLSVFDSTHFITMLLRKDKTYCDLSHCEGCHLNPDNKTLESIQTRIEEANRFAKEIAIEKRVELKPYEENRRDFFKAIFTAAKEVVDDESLKDRQKERLPIKHTLLKNSIKIQSANIPNKQVSTSYTFFGNRSIDESCTNCGDCIQFCPTQALFYAKDATAIWFTAGRCIDCDICNDICKSHSINNRPDIDLVTWAFDRGEELIEFTFETCKECNTPFVYRGGEPICDRCKQFVENFGDIFKLASDIEE